jgi:HEPN domain-containing protein
MSEQQATDLACAWLVRARSDLSLGRAALRARGVLPEDVCFHAQQCAEKSLKSLLTNRWIEFLRTHVIEVLLDLLKENGLAIPQNVDDAFELTQYAVQARYPGEWEPIIKKRSSTCDRTCSLGAGMS